MIAAPLPPRAPHSHPRACSGRCSPPRETRRVFGSIKLAEARLGFGFSIVAGDTGFYRSRVCGTGRCRPGCSWHALEHFATDSFAHELSGAKEWVTSLVIQIPRHFDQIRGSVLCQTWTHPIRSPFYTWKRWWSPRVDLTHIMGRLVRRGNLVLQLIVFVAHSNIVNTLRS